MAVDDRRDNLFVIEQLMGEYLSDCRLITSTSAEEGLGLATNQPIDAALIDVNMPGLDGIEMVRRLKADERTASIPILLLTAHQASSELLAKGLDAGADDFLSQPVDNVELVARIRVILRIKRAEDELREVNANLEEQVVKRTRELREIEQRSLQAQKMEAIGQLAGGIAHDFNNLLTAIQGNAELLQLHLADDQSKAHYAEQISRASKRAAELTRQLLAFARKGKLQVVNIDPHEVISEVANLLARSIDRRIEIRKKLHAAPPTINGDPTQLENALLNLALNARDAMPDGGTITFATRNIIIDEAFACDRPYEVIHGSYVELAVSDTGVGMSEDVQSHLFEPFYTTKDVGKGTGLGLASVYGCVKSHGGYIEVSSRPGDGTTFRVLLPSVSASDSAQVSDQVLPVKGKGHILLVDDEELIRKYAVEALEYLGYRVSACSGGAEGIDLFRRHDREIDLVILDLVMPKMDGRETLKALRTINSDVRVLLSTGYSAHEIARDGAVEGVVGFLSKPYRIHDLAEIIARHLPRADRA